MAFIHCWDGGSNTPPYETWAKAATTFSTACGATSAGDTIRVAQDHSETLAASVNFVVAGTKTNPVIIYSADRADDTYSAGTAVQIGNDGGLRDFGFSGFAICYGVWFNPGDDFDGAQANSDAYWVFDDCRMEVDDVFRLISGRNTYEFRGGTIEFNSGATGFRFQSDSVQTKVIIRGTQFLFNATSVTNFVEINGAVDDHFEFSLLGCDISSESATNLVDPESAADKCRFLFDSCKIPASITINGGGLDTYDSWIRVINCDDGSDLYRTEIYTAPGDVLTDSGVTHSGGFSDETGSGTGTDLSHKMTPNTRTDKVTPLESMPMMAYIDSTGSKTFTVEAVENFTTALQDDEAWMEVRYLGTSGEAIRALDTTRVVADGTNESDLTAGDGLANWTSEPSGSRSVKFASTVTVNNVGYYEVRIYLAKNESGKVLHYDPKVVVS